MGFTIGELLLGSLLLAVSALWAWGRAIPLKSALALTPWGVALGVVVSLPALVGLFLLVGETGRALPGGAGLQDSFGTIRDILGPVAWWQIIVISAMAGLSEEVLFRGVVQWEVGIVAAAVIFGLCHPLGVGYVVYASVLGLYLGLAARLTGGLVAPILAHALYDAVGLWYLTRRWQPPGREGPLSAESGL